jgi:hypothetical protein
MNDMTTTDPISAAVGYRMALERIMKARVLHEARQIASKALAIQFDRPTGSHVSVASGYGHNTKEPFVTVGIANPTESANPVVQIATYDARKIAMHILEAADAAESDAFLVGWLGGQSLTEAQVAALLNDFRQYRERRR